MPCIKNTSQNDATRLIFKEFYVGNFKTLKKKLKLNNSNECKYLVIRFNF